MHCSCSISVTDRKFLLFGGSRLSHSNVGYCSGDIFTCNVKFQRGHQAKRQSLHNLHQTLPEELQNLKGINLQVGIIQSKNFGVGSGSSILPISTLNNNNSTYSNNYNNDGEDDDNVEDREARISTARLRDVTLSKKLIGPR